MIGFVDEGHGHCEAARHFRVSLKFVNDLVKTTGWAPRGARLVDHAPFGHWRMQTFFAALRRDCIDAPWVMTGAIKGEMFDLYIDAQLAPALKAGDVVILDNLSSHKSPGAAQALKDIGARFRFREKPTTGRFSFPSNVPPYSPDLNPIETAFSKRKALIRKAAGRTYDDLWQAVGHVCSLFSDEECYNSFKAAGYETD